MESGLAEAEERRSPRAHSPAREASVESAPHHEPLGVAVAAPSAPSGRAPPLSPRAPGPNGGSSLSRRGRSPRASPAGSPRQLPVRRHASPARPDDGATGPQPPVLPARHAAPPANRSRSSHGGRGRGRGWRGWNGSLGRGSYHAGPAQSSLQRALQSLPSVLEGALTRAFSAAPHTAPTLDPSRSRLPGSSAAAPHGGPRVAGEAVAAASTVRPRLLRDFPTAHEGGHRSSRCLVVASMQARNRADPGPPTVTTAKVSLGQLWLAECQPMVQLILEKAQVLLQGSPSGTYVDHAGEACLQHAAEIAALVGPVLDAPAQGGAVASTLFLPEYLLVRALVYLEVLVLCISAAGGGVVGNGRNPTPFPPHDTASSAKTHPHRSQPPPFQHPVPNPPVNNPSCLPSSPQGLQPARATGPPGA
ncbi:unnamed protein product [Closterium sp. NIES-65]|nr:unnamed protein product [Closterium sp. NIES-65]